VTPPLSPRSSPGQRGPSGPNSAKTRGGRVLSAARDALIILVVSALLFGALELGVRFVAPQDSTTTFLEGGSLGLPDDALGHVSRPGSVTRHESPEFSVEYRVNESGLRDETPHPMPRTPHTSRVLLVGDSFAFGACVDYERTFAAVAERRLREEGLPVDIVKAGVSGYDTQREVIWIERLLPEYDPDAVVLVFLPNDLFTNRPLDEPLPAPEEDVAVRYRAQKSTRLHLLTLAKRLVLESDSAYRALYRRSARSAYYVQPWTDRIAEQVAITDDLLRAANDVCREAGIPLVVYSIPQQYQVLAGGQGVGGLDRHFAETAARDSFVWIPALPGLAESYRRTGEDLFFRFDGHLNPRGCEIVGNHLAVCLRPVVENAVAPGH
jgi:lysophospholipase L1-like esterase